MAGFGKSNGVGGRDGGMDAQNDEDLKSLVCSVEDIEASIKGYLSGDLTLAQIEGYSAQDLYGIADIGYTLMEEGKLEDARRIFEGLNAFNPHDPYFHSVLGSIHQKQGNRDAALSYYGKAVQLYPQDINAWTNSGELMLQQSLDLVEVGKDVSAQETFEKSIAALEHAIRLDPDCKNPSGLRARALVTVAASAAGVV